ncbi:MAG: hypothetical protein KAJ51_16630 [Thermoplasmata archaeon]|nr:hypothetical protein [Thermoplasmata archaeon]
MRTYIDVIFTPGMIPAEFAEAMLDIGLEMLFGPHDFVIEWETYKEFNEKFKKVLPVLQKFQVNYRMQTYEVTEEDLSFMNVASSKL